MKLTNFLYTVSYAPSFLPPLSSIKWPAASEWVRPVLFFSLVPSLGLLVLTLPGLALLVVSRRAGTSVSSAGFKCLLVGCATTVAWCLMMFSGTCIHQGTLFNPLILLAGLALVCFWLSRVFGIVLLALQVGFFAAIYVPLSKLCVPLQNTIWLQNVDFGMGVMTVLAVGAYLALLRKAPC